MCLSLSIYTDICIYLSICLSIYLSISLSIYIYIYISIYVYTYIQYIYIYIYIYMHTHINNTITYILITTGLFFVLDVAVSALFATTAGTEALNGTILGVPFV